MFPAMDVGVPRPPLWRLECLVVMTTTLPFTSLSIFL